MPLKLFGDYMVMLEYQINENKNRIYAILAVLIAEICCIADSVISQSKYTRLIILGQ